LHFRLPGAFADMLYYTALAALSFSAPATQHAASRAVSRVVVSPTMGPVLHGTPQSRSPLVNWFAFEAGIEFEMAPPRPSPHPFGQVPCLVDDNDVVVFESGAILLYLLDAYGFKGDTPTAAEKAAMTSWVVWANSELDGLCFGAVPGDHRVRGTSMEKADLKSVATLEALLSEKEWLIGGRFTVADAAVGSYLNYVPIFFPGADLSKTPAIAAYMKRCAERPLFAQAFGEQHADLVRSKASGWLDGPAGGAGPADMLKKLLG